MSKAASSPTARLLQHSRLFSLPRPLPPPGLDSPTSTGLYRASDTATSAYPTHQAIATPSSSHHRGDWGLKRPLPSKATRSSTPLIRVRAHDNTEHITDFGSAADHTLTARKWAEMGIPLVRRKERIKGERSAPVSVFEDHVDETTGTATATSWKSGGPWLAGMQQGEFELFVRQLTARRGVGGAKDVKGRSRVDDFREFVKARLADERYGDARNEARQRGDTLSPAQTAQLRSELRPNDEELDAHFHELRLRYTEDNLSSRLTIYISDFLDLPAVKSSDTNQDAFLNKVIDNFNLDGPETSPPSTHPSAGLSYIRTNAVLQNHPLYGPQAQPSPVLSRVLRARSSTQGSEHSAKLGVGGVVTNDPVTLTYNSKADRDRLTGTSATGSQPERSKYDADTMTDTLDPYLEGGNKIWVHPKQAHIDEKGRIHLEVARAVDEAIAVKHDDVEHINQARASSAAGPIAPRSFAPPGTAGNANYGTALPDMRRVQNAPVYSPRIFGESTTDARQPQSRGPEPSRRPGIRGFDQGLGLRGRMGENEAMARIRELGRGVGRGGGL